MKTSKILRQMKVCKKQKNILSGFMLFFFLLAMLFGLNVGVKQDHFKNKFCIIESKYIEYRPTRILNFTFNHELKRTLKSININY